MWTCRAARITPCFNSTTPCGPTSTQPGVFWMSPLSRTGRSMPSEIPSVKANSTGVSGRVGPKHPHGGQHPPLGSHDHHRFFRGEEAVLVQILLRPSACAPCRTASPCPASVRWQCRAETLTGNSLAGRAAYLGQHDLANNLLDQFPVNRCGNAHAGSWQVINLCSRERFPAGGHTCQLSNLGRSWCLRR